MSLPVRLMGNVTPRLPRIILSSQHTMERPLLGHFHKKNDNNYFKLANSNNINNLEHIDGGRQKLMIILYRYSYFLRLGCIHVTLYWGYYVDLPKHPQMHFMHSNVV